MGLHVKQPNPIPLAVDDPETVVARWLSIPARIRPLGGPESAQRELGEGDLFDDEAASAAAEDWFWFTAEISSTALDAYFTHMTDSTLRNFARDAANGVALLDSHDGYKLGVGYSAGGRYEEENGDGRAVGVFYVVPGIAFGGKHSFASSDDYVKAIRSGIVRDVSVGFYGGRWICDLCHQPYYGQGSACNHIAGWEYEIEIDGRMQKKVCTVAIDDAGLSEVSLVYDGATPGAMIIKAEDEAEAGRLSPTMIRQIERQYRIQLPRARATSGYVYVWGEQQNPAPVITTASTNGSVVVGRSTENGAPAGRGQGEDMDEELEVEIGVTQEETADLAEADDAARAAIAEFRQAVAETAAPQGTPLVAAVRWLNEQLAQATQERDAAQAEVARLQPLADQGRAYREELINQAVVEGVRALGEAFPEETYRAMLTNAPLEHIRQVRDTFANQAAVRFPGGRQTRDLEKDDEQTPKRTAVPAAAYGVN